LAFQIFVSYARDDDFVSREDADSPKTGFVSKLVQGLRDEFRALGPQPPALWQDVGRIDFSDQFDPILKNEIDKSDALLVILSRNWLDRPWCRQELELFEKRWIREGQDAVKSRIVVVEKHPVALTRRPDLLKGQEGVKFYHRDRDSRDELEAVEYVRHGRLRAEFEGEYDLTIERLARNLYRRAQLAKPAPHEQVLSSRAHHRVYLAKPANSRLQITSRIASGVLLPNRHGGWFSMDGEYGSGLSSAICPLGTPGNCKRTPHTTFDVEEGIAIAPKTALTLDVQNLLNDRYFVTLLNAQGNHYAPPRTFSVGVRVMP
jgi:hypothetical protein